MSPQKFIAARESNLSTTIYGKPYHPNIYVDANDEDSILSAAIAVLLLESTDTNLKTESWKDVLKIETVVGGITNKLFCIEGFSSLNMNYNKVLLRVFGAEGLIDRDVETSTLACLSEGGISPSYLGRFGNGRVELWLENHSTVHYLRDFQDEETTDAIAVQMQKLHSEFHIPPNLKEWHSETNPVMWGQLDGWLNKAKTTKTYKTPGDTKRAAETFDFGKLERELNWLKEKTAPLECRVAFCHNDLLAANMMKDNDSGEIMFIDYEYGSVNYIAFDIANHFNMYAGSVENNGVPNYDLFPSKERQLRFVSSYVCAGDPTRREEKKDTIALLFKEVQLFLLVSQMYWGFWGINQASAIGTEDFDYFSHAENKFTRYDDLKEDILNDDGYKKCFWCL